MDKEWVFLHRRSAEYMDGLRAFISNALALAAIDGEIKCPCKSCANRHRLSPMDVENHLEIWGMDDTYANGIWDKHGEKVPTVFDTNSEFQNEDMQGLLADAFGMPDYVHNPDVPDVAASPSHESTPYATKFYQMVEEAETELYPGCGRSKLSFLVRLYQIKVMCGWTDSSLTKLLDLLKEWFPNIQLPDSFYKTKKFITDLGLTYEKIDACPRDCMLYYKEHANDASCQFCGVSRYKKMTDQGNVARTKVPQKVLRYFPLGPRLQRLYLSRHIAESMVWHAEHRPKDDVLRHPADSKAWSKLDSIDPTFGNEARNVRLGLASDGFNPFGTMSQSHSTWPVVMSVYNLPPWLCMKKPYLMLSLLIPGPTSPGNNIDVYLRPLLDELKSLWEEGIPTYDAFKKETFKMRAAVMWIINDFPAYAMLSGWSTKGYKACPNCGHDTRSVWLPNSQKCSYLGHRRWLPILHRFRRWTVAFDGHQEHKLPPVPMTGADCLQQLSTLTFQFGKKMKNSKKNGKRKRSTQDIPYDGPWKKQSILFELPYWKDLLLRHNLDVMHIEKNVTDSVLGTLLATDRKNKDTYNARLDCVHLGIKKGLQPKSDGARPPSASFNLKPEEKTLMCEVFASSTLPDGVASNIARSVRVEEKKLAGLKSHDSHIIMQYLLPLAIRHALPKFVARIFIELSSFFRNLCTKVGTVAIFNSLSRRIAIVLCMLEHIMPPSFFDVMVHLPIHLADEAAIGGPVYFRWMFPIERFLGSLKKYVRNKARPEGSIAEGYIVEECLSFCGMYLGDTTVGRINKPGRNADASDSGERVGLSVFANPGRSLGTYELFQLDDPAWNRARRHVLDNTPDVWPYKCEFVEREIANRGTRVSAMTATNQANLSFPAYFEALIEDKHNNRISDISDDFLALARGPSRWAKRWTKYIMNGFRFNVKSVDDGTTQNSGVFVEMETDSFATANDPNPKSGMVEYYGVLKDIIELDYRSDRKVVLFDCDWVNGSLRRSGIKKDDFGFTLVNFERLLPPTDTLVFGSQAQQVFYVNDPITKEWQVAVRTTPRDYFDMGRTTHHDLVPPQDLDSSVMEDDEVEGRTDMTEILSDEEHLDSEGEA